MKKKPTQFIRKDLMEWKDLEKIPYSELEKVSRFSSTGISKRLMTIPVKSRASALTWRMDNMFKVGHLYPQYAKSHIIKRHTIATELS